MQSYLSAVWKCRYFWLALVHMDLRTRYRRSALGMGWSMLHPIVMTIVICVVFHRIFQVQIRDFAPSLLSGMCIWSFITAVVANGCQCLFHGESYIRQYPAPIAIYPLRVVLGASVHFLCTLIVVLLLTWFLKGFGNLPLLFALIPACVLLFVFGWSLAVLAGFATAYFPDTQHFSEVGLQILFYATPIMYPTKLLEQRGLGWITRVNPLGALLQVFRDPLLEGHLPSLEIYSIATMMVACTAAAAVMTLVRLQQKIVFQL